MNIEISEKQESDMKKWHQMQNSSNCELFFMNGRATNTVFVNNEKEYIDQALAYNYKGYTCYSGIQPRPYGLERPATNSDITGISRLYIDIDPITPSSNICASDEENARTREAAEKISADSVSSGFNKPIIIDSGNGHWLFFKIPEIRITDTNRREMELRLKAWGAWIKEKYQDKFPDVKIDSNVYDLRRIAKIPGTRAQNKAEAEGRPQRIASIVSDHEPVEDMKLLEYFLSLPIPEQQACQPVSTPSAGALKPDRIIQKCHAMQFLKDKADTGNSLPHDIRLALSTISNALDDLGNDLSFIMPILQGCPDFDKNTTRNYLELNRSKCAPYSCEKWKELISGHYSDFDSSKCNCNLPKRDKQKPSPIRYAYPTVEDMVEDFNTTSWDVDSVKRYQQLEEFSSNWSQYVKKPVIEELLRGNKKELGLRVPTIKELVKDDEPSDEKKITDKLIQIATDLCSFFKDYDDIVYCEVPVAGHIEIYRINSKYFKSWLRHKYYEEVNKSVSSQSLIEAVATLEAINCYTAPVFPVYIRIGGLDDKIYIDLCNDKWEAVEIDAAGYRIIHNPPVKFIRAKGMLPLPYPVDGSLDVLTQYLNLRNPGDALLIASFLIAAARPTGPYPILCLCGEPGVAKSSFCKFLRNIIDPSTTPLRQAPKAAWDFMISAMSSWIQAFDNLSSIPLWWSDMLCRLATGGGMSVRTLFTDGEETLFQASRPIIINGISAVAVESDLADRTILIELEVIPDDKRKTESEILEYFEEGRPQILGWLCEAVSTALKNLPNTKLKRLPRMADFAVWATAAEPAYCNPGEFMEVYSGNRQVSINESLASSPVMDAIFQMVDTTGFTEWIGTASQLLKQLSEMVDGNTLKSKDWPKDASALSKKLKKTAPQLRSRGIYFDNSDRKNKSRNITLRKVNDSAVTPVTPVNVNYHIDNIDKFNDIDVTGNVQVLSPENNPVTIECETSDSTSPW